MIRNLAFAIAVTMIGVPAQADNPAALTRALEAASDGDWAIAMGQARVAGSVAIDILEWQKLRAGEGVFAEYYTFVTQRGDWPGLPLLRSKGELKILAGEAPERVKTYFADQLPQTATGSLALMAAYRATGATDKADAEAIRAWRSLRLSRADEAAFLKVAGKVLKDHHGGRIAAKLAAGRLDDARRMLPLVSAGTRAVAEARIALQRQARGVDKLIKAVPESMSGSAGLAYDRFIWRIRKDRYDDAAALMLERSADVKNLGNPGDWANWRRILARREMRQGDANRAYQMASRHGMSAGWNYADLEWLSGYIALRKLNRPAVALEHFQKFGAAVATPISLARAGYWEGRALEELGRPDEAARAFGFASEYQSAFYGQLAAERLGLPLDVSLAGREPYPDWRRAPFTASTVFQAAVLLKAVGEVDLAERFLLHLAETLPGDQIGGLAGLALDWREPHIALLLAKAAAAKGAVWPRAYFPLTGLETKEFSVAPELVMAIARRESEFDPDVASGAGALGLMQVMPRTAKAMAEVLEEPYEKSRLTTDPDYNARLGAAYLAELTEEFGPSVALIAAGYNAGPSRSRRWMSEFGDPRKPDVDVVDWIEHIQFRETQNYVMRVAESVIIYRARLTGKTGSVGLTDLLKGR